MSSGEFHRMNLNVAVIMPPGRERDQLVEHLTLRHCTVRVSDEVATFLARQGSDSCEIALLEFPFAGSGSPSELADALEAKRRDVKRLRENWPKLQMVVFADRDTQQATETLELGVRNIFLKPVNFEQLDGLLSAAGKSVAQQARQQREHASWARARRSRRPWTSPGAWRSPAPPRF
jgi:DNA-binding NarL/FixJ family response regulator